MATLNTLRTKGGAVLAVVIGISLLAFLLGDLANSGGALWSSSKMNVGEVNGQTITYNDYLERVEQIKRAQQIMSGSETVNDEQIRSAAWESVVRDCSFDGSINNLGLSISPDELKDMVNGTWISPIIRSIFVNPQTGSFDQQLLVDYISNLDNDQTGNSRFFWRYIENEIGEERAMNKYMSLVKNAIFTTDLEVAEGVENSNRFFNVNYVARSIASVPDSAVNVTDADLRAYYDSHKRLFKQSEIRELQYVLFEALPSEADYKEAETSVAELADQLKNSDDPVQFAKINGATPISLVFKGYDEFSGDIATFAKEAAEGDIYGPVFDGSKHTVARLVARKNMPDTIGFRQIILAPESQNTADSIITELKKGASFEQLVLAHSLDRQTPGGDVGRINPALLGGEGFEEFTEKLLASNKGEIFSVKTPYGIAVIENTYRGKMIPRVQVASIDYLVEPGRQTQQEAYASASKFASSLAAKGADFNKIATESGLVIHVARLVEGENLINNIEQSGEMARWAFDAKEGANSDVISIGDANYVLNVVSIREHGQADFNKVKGDIRAVVLNQAKTNKLKEEMKGKSVTELSEKFALEIKEASNVNFSSFYIDNLGVAPAAIGAITGCKEGETTAPVESVSDVAVFEIKAVDERMETNDKSEKVMLQSTAETNIQNRAYNAVFDLADIHDTRIKFF